MKWFGLLSYLNDHVSRKMNAVKGPLWITLELANHTQDVSSRFILSPEREIWSQRIDKANGPLHHIYFG